MSLSIAIGLTACILACVFIFIIWNYAKQLKSSPRELFILFISKILEYSAYGAMNLAFVLYLSSDLKMGDISAGSYIGTWSLLLTIGTMMVGAICDAIGIRKTLIIGSLILIVSRIFLPLTTNIYAVTILAFIPMALGMAILGPVLSVGIKKYTNKETLALGFALFYTIMNVGWAIGAWIFDFVRTHMGEHGTWTMPLVGLNFSTYQVIFLVGLALTIPNFFIVASLREGVRMKEDGPGYIYEPELKKISTQKTSVLKAFKEVSTKAFTDTINIFKSVVFEKSFWLFLFMLGILIFVRFTFYHFHYTFPKYGIRTLGEGLKIGSIFGVLNPFLIIFLAPLFAYLTRKVASYYVLAVGTTISSLAIFIALLPHNFFAFLNNTWLEELVLVRWLAIPEALQTPYFFSLVLMVIVFTIGEAIWSPRLMQFTAELAPKGREGSYIALSYLPYFGGKLVVGPFSGWLLATYVPAGGVNGIAGNYPSHNMVWLWMGACALISPLGLFIFKNIFLKKNISEEESPLEEEKSPVTA